MRSWSVNSRFTLSILVFFLPLVAMVYFLYVAANEQVLFSEREELGATHLAKVFEFQRDLTRAHFDAARSGQDLSEAEKEKFLKTWESLVENLGSQKLSKKKLLSNLTKYLKSAPTEKKGGGRYLLFQQDVQALQDDIADQYYIVLDPDLDSFYTMEMLVMLLPQARAQYAQIAQILGNADSFLYDFQRERLVSLLGIYEETVRKILVGLEKVRSNDANFYGESKSFQENLSSYQNLLRSQMRAVYGVMMRPDEFLRSTPQSLLLIQQLIQKNDEFHESLRREYLTFVSERLVSLRSSRDRKLYWSLAAILFSIIVSGYLGLTINKTFGVFKLSLVSLKEQAESAIQVGNSLHESANQVSDSSSSQSAAIEQTSASLEELGSMVKVTSDNSQSARDLALQAKEHASSGVREMRDLRSTMDDIRGSSKKIEEIMKIIDDIAFQTNLLALNASVEAARAGEHGKGFAVVADAVRSLAQKSADSAKEIGVLISESIEKIEKGHSGAERSSQSMELILNSVEKVNALNADIATASREQASGIDQITKAVTELEKATLQNTQVAQQAQEYSRTSLEQAESLQKVVTSLENELSGAS